MITEQNVYEALKGVRDPELGGSLVELGMVRDVTVAEGKVSLTLALTTLECPFKDRLVAEVRQTLFALAEVEDVAVGLAAMTPTERARTFQMAEESLGPASIARQMNQVDRVVAVMSGKGGVGKSLVTALLAVALARQGFKLGILDADLTGASIPKMFGLHQRPPTGSFGILPVQSRMGIEVMSINLLLEREDDAVIWRGPLVGKAIRQFWEEVVWGHLDYLLVDLPPGTSDAPLTVMQSMPLTGVVIVTSPQDLAGMIVRKAVQMAQKLNVPILGVVENMAYFVCPDTGKHHQIFGPSRGQEMAQVAGASLLAQLPLDPTIARLCDAGQIETLDSEVSSKLGEAFAAAARRLVAQKTTR